MHVLFVSPAIAPYSGGTSPRAALVAALPKALRTLEHRVTVLSPLLAGVEPTRHGLARRLTKLEVSVQGETFACELYTGRSPSGVELAFLGQEPTLGGVSALDAGSPTDVAKRYGVLARAVVRYVADADPAIDLVHGFGPFGALAALHVAGAAGRRVPVAITIDDANDLGALPSALAPVLGLPGDVGATSIVAAIAEKASAVMVLPPGNLPRLRAVPGIAEAIHARPGAFHAVPLGVDTAAWNPLTDVHLPARFDPIDLRGKAKCKQALQRACSLPARPEIPLVAVLPARPGERFLERFAEIAIDALRNDAQWIVLADGKSPTVDALTEIASRFSDRLAVDVDPSVTKAHRLLAGADAALVTTTGVPSDPTAAYAQRYGALPIVLDEPGASDMVVDCDAALRTGSGFIVDRPAPDALLGTLQRVIAAYASKNAFDERKSRTMRLDLSWERSARLHDRVYRASIEAGEDAA